MDTVTILRDLWRLRRYVVGVCVLALLAGVVAMYRIPNFESRGYEVGIATAHILVDTPRSQIVAVSPKGSDLLAGQANLLASLMVDGAIKSAIAQRSGLQPNHIVGVTDAATRSSASGPAPVPGPWGPRAFVLTTHLLTDSAGANLPIIEVDAQAPSRAAAARLARAAIAGLGDYLASKAALQRIPDANRLQVSGLGVQATTERRGPSGAIAIAAVILVFVLGCASMLAVLAVVRAWRAASLRDHLDDGELLVWDVGSRPDEYFLDPVGARQTDRASPGTSAKRIAAGSAEGRPASNGTGSSGGNGSSGDSSRSKQGVREYDDAENEQAAADAPSSGDNGSSSGKGSSGGNGYSGDLRRSRRGDREYDDAENEQALLDARIALLEEQLRPATAGDQHEVA